MHKIIVRRSLCQRNVSQSSFACGWIIRLLRRMWPGLAPLMLLVTMVGSAIGEDAKKDKELQEPICVLDQSGKKIDELACERVRLDVSTEEEAFKPDIRLDFSTARTSDGTIYAQSFPGFLFSSKDGGRTWDRDLLRDLGVSGGRTHPILKWRWVRGFGAKDNVLLAQIEETYIDADARGDPNNFQKVSISRSTDGGQNWEQPVKLDARPFPTSFTDGGTSTVLPDGTIVTAVGAMYFAGWQEHGFKLPPGMRGMNVLVFASQDDGKTWERRSFLCEHAAETQLLAKKDGSLLAVIRRQRYMHPEEDSAGINFDKVGRTGKVLYKVLFLADSYDGGYTWVNLRQFTDVVGDCHGEAVELSDGRIVLIWNSRYGQPSIVAKVSKDGGSTWSDESYRLCEGQGYPGSVVLEDDIIVTVTGDKKGPTTGQAIRWKLPKLVSASPSGQN